MPAVRVIGDADIAAAVRLNQAAGWNQTEQDWRNLLRLAPESCFGIDRDGMLVATTTAVCYGCTVAWIGMVLTDLAYRRRGLAQILMEHTLEHLSRREIEWIKLDATDMGAPLYRKLGFEDECPIERWLRPGEIVRQTFPTPGNAGTLIDAEIDRIDAEIDRVAFGAARSKLLHLLAQIESTHVAGVGYAMGRPGTKAAYFGPCVSRSADAARDLLHWFIARHVGESIFWDLLPGNAAAVNLAGEFGFEPVRRLVRMARPGRSPFLHNDKQVFAIAGFEYG